MKQAAELDWWYTYLQSPGARARMHAIYGARYAAFFYKEMTYPGAAVEFGSGPMPVLELALSEERWAVDTLAEKYRELGLYLSDIALLESAETLGDGSLDTALVLNMLDHCDDPAGVMREAARLLKAGGQALVFVHIARADDKHYSIGVREPLDWIAGAGLEIVRKAIRQPNSFDPPAFMAIARKV